MNTLKHYLKKSLVMLLVLTLVAGVIVITGSQKAEAQSNTYTVTGTTHYLALRTAPRYDSRNEIGKLYNGETVTLENTGNGTYWYVYSPKLDESGYVNKKYLTSNGSCSSYSSNSYSNSSSSSTYTVSGTTHYLALRTQPAYDDRNIIGKLYNGETVTLENTGNGTYWYVYSPKLDKSGYVNKRYLTSGGSYSSSYSNSNYSSSNYGTYTVMGTTNFLALRTQPAYDDSNIIGKLYNGETVTVENTGNGTYWYVYSPKLGQSGYVNAKYLG